jgi:hypothetical protein
VARAVRGGKRVRLFVLAGKKQAECDIRTGIWQPGWKHPSPTQQRISRLQQEGNGSESGLEERELKDQKEERQLGVAQDTSFSVLDGLQ